MAISIQQLYKNAGNTLLGFIPNKEGVKPETVDKIKKWGHIVSTPHLNRVIMGGATILSQPFFDYFNPNVDKDTAETSAIRTVAKIVAGTIVGVGVRWGCYKFMRNAIKKHSFFQFEDFEAGTEEAKKYISGASNLLALLAILATNFLVDIPFTNYLSKKLIAFYKGNKSTDSNSTYITQTGERNPSQSAADRIKDAFQNFESGRKAGA